MPRYLCDGCKYDYGDACRRPERPNARFCPDYSPRDVPQLWVPSTTTQSAREFLDTLPVVTEGDHPEIRQAARERLRHRLVAAAAIAGVVLAVVLALVR